MINLDRLIYGRLLEGSSYDGYDGTTNTTNKIDQSQIAGNGIYEWRPVPDLYGSSQGKKAFAIYNGKLYRVLPPVLHSVIDPETSPYWEEVGNVSGSSTPTVNNFIDLNDTPDEYSGNENKVLAVDNLGNGVEFIDKSTIGVTSFTELSDTPDDLSLDNQYLVTQDNRLVLMDVPIDGGYGGAEAFIDLIDVENDYSGNAGNLVAVNATEDGLEFIEPPTGEDIDLSTKSFTELSDTPNDISANGKILITNNNQLTLSDLPTDCGIILNNSTYLKNGNDLTINDIQQFINKAVKDLFVERPPLGYSSIKCINPVDEIYPINKGLIEKVLDVVTSYSVSNVGINGFNDTIEVRSNYEVRNQQGDIVTSFLNTSNILINIIADVPFQNHKRILDTSKKVYERGDDGKYEQTEVVLPNNDSFEFSYCGKYVLAIDIRYTDKFFIYEFNETTADSYITHEFQLQNITSDINAIELALTSNIIDDFIIIAQVNNNNRIKAIKIKVDLQNFTHTEEVLFEKDIPTNVYVNPSNFKRFASSLDKSIIAFMNNNTTGKLCFLIKDSSENYRTVVTERNISYGISFGVNNYFSVSNNISNLSVYKFNPMPSLLCSNQRVETVVTTYSKTVDKVAVITDTVYALLKTDGIYLWDITANTETFIINDSTIYDIDACATHIIYTYGVGSNNWAVIDLSGNFIKSGYVSLEHPSIDIVQTTTGFNYIVEDYDDSQTNPFRYVIKDENDNIILNQGSTDNFSVAIKNYNTIVGVRSDIVNNSNSTIIIAKIDSNGISTGDAYFDNVIYAPNNIEVANDNVIVNVHNANNEYTSIILCIEDLTNIGKCGIFNGRKGCSTLYDSVFNNVVSVDINSNIIVLDYDR